MDLFSDAYCFLRDFRSCDNHKDIVQSRNCYVTVKQGKLAATESGQFSANNSMIYAVNNSISLKRGAV